MKFAIIGKMGSGKSTCANYLKDIHNFEIHSFGGPVKKYALEIFNEKNKNRKLIQDFAQKIKEIDNDVWVKYLLDKADLTKNIIVDDLRFPNEYKALKDNGFKIIKLTISEELQEKRLIETYPENYRIHLERRNDISESYTDSLPFDYEIIVDNKSRDELFGILYNIVKG